MPIEDFFEGIKPSDGFPRIGKLHKGARRTEEDIKKKRPGKDLPYFRIEFEPQFEHLRPAWEEMYTTRPTFFDPVYVFGQTIEEAFDFWFEEWTASTLLHRCNGREQVLWFDQNPKVQRHSRARIPCRYDAPKGQRPPGCGDCRLVGRLNLMLPKFIDATGVLGYIMAETHATNDITEIYTTLNTVAYSGPLFGVQFRFGRAPKTISVPKTDRNTGERSGRMKVEKSLFHLYVNEDYTRNYFLPGLRAAAAMPRFGAPEPQPALPARTTEESRALLGRGETARRLVADDYRDEPGGAPDVTDADYEDDEPQGAAQPHFAHDSDKLIAFFRWLQGAYFIPSDVDLLGFMDIESLSDLPADLKDAALAVNNAVFDSRSAENSFPMFARAATYHKESRGAYFEFDTTLRTRWYGHRETLAKQLKVPALANAEDGQTIALGGRVSMAWERRGDNGNAYLLALEFSELRPDAPEEAPAQTEADAAQEAFERLTDAAP